MPESTAKVIAFALLLISGPARAEGTQGTALAYGEYYELGYGGGPTGLVGDGSKAVSMFGLTFHERHGIIGKAVVGVPVFLAMALTPAGRTDYLGHSTVTFIDQNGAYVGTAHTDYYQYTETEEDRQRHAAAIDSTISGIGHWPMTFDLAVFHEKLGSSVDGWFAAWLPFGVMPRLYGPPIVMDFGVSAGQLRAVSDPMSRDFSELALAIDVELPIVRYLELDLKQRLNALGAHRTSAGLTANLGNRLYARVAASLELPSASRPLGLRFEGGFRF